MNKPVGATVRRLRRRAGVGVTAFAGEVGCSRQHLTNVESGTYGPSIELLNRIARRLGVDVEDLLHPEGDEAA